MALTPLVTFKLAKALKAKPGARIAAMGYPDIIASKKTIDEALGDDLRFKLEYRSDSEAICRRHFGPDAEARPIPDAKSFFGLLGAELDVFDVVQERGDEILCDLNYPMDKKHQEQYAFVLDVGTMEHCFNVGQAAMNMASLLRAGGVIFHENPFCMGNHGFYSMNPTWYADFYGQAGFRLDDCRLLFRNGKQAVLGEEDRISRFLWQFGEANCYAVATRTEILPVTFPVQTKYRTPAKEWAA